MNILINAYACAPNMGSEPGMAWNWIINLAKYCRVFVITEGEWRQEIEKELESLPQKENIIFFYSPVSARIRKMCWNQGDWRFYIYYRRWQLKTLSIARKILKEHPIDVVHQLNMIGFREPGYLFKLKKPIVWGPVDAKEVFPTAYLVGASVRERIFIHLKNIITHFQLKSWKRIKNAVQRSTFLVSASSQSVITFRKFFNKETILLNETGCYISDKKKSHLSKSSEFVNLLWVGKFDFRKQLTLALESISLTNNLEKIKLNIVGGTKEEEDYYKAIADKLNISNACIWHGRVSHSKVQELMQLSDLFFFTSIAEGTPHVVLEAIGNNLPVLCFNTCGHGDVVNDLVGVKIELSTPEKSKFEFASHIDSLILNPSRLLEMSANCTQRQKELTWDVKAKQMVELYGAAIKRNI